MKKADLYRLKSLVGCLSLVATLGITTGCSANMDKTDTAYEVSHIERDTTENHEHLIITIGGITYIYRECGSEVSRIAVSANASATSYTVYDNNGKEILSGFTTDGVNVSYIRSALEEQHIREIEDDLIDQGAVLKLK